MEVILLEKIERLGDLGAVVKVKSGYGRNFLIPQRKALPSTAGNRARFEADRAALEQKQMEMRSEAELLAARIAQVRVVLQRPAGSNDKLFGAVTSSDLSDYFAAQGIAVPRRVIELAQPIKKLGEHLVTLKLHPDVAPEVAVTVERSA